MAEVYSGQGEFNPSDEMCRRCWDGKFDPTNWNGLICRYVGTLKHPGECNFSNGIRVVADVPVERITPDTPLKNWAKGLFGVR